MPLLLPDPPLCVTGRIAPLIPLLNRLHEATFRMPSNLSVSRQGYGNRYICSPAASAVCSVSKSGVHQVAWR